MSVCPNQQGYLDMQEFRRALNILPADQREALVLVGAAGFSYEEAASVSGCAVGTIKSRVNRARRKLTELLERRGLRRVRAGLNDPSNRCQHGRQRADSLGRLRLVSLKHGVRAAAGGRSVCSCHLLVAEAAVDVFGSLVSRHRSVGRACVTLPSPALALSSLPHSRRS